MSIKTINCESLGSIRNSWTGLKFSKKSFAIFKKEISKGVIENSDYCCYLKILINGEFDNRGNYIKPYKVRYGLKQVEKHISYMIFPQNQND